MGTSPDRRTSRPTSPDRRTSRPTSPVTRDPLVMRGCPLKTCGWQLLRFCRLGKGSSALALALHVVIPLAFAYAERANIWSFSFSFTTFFDEIYINDISVV